jgi:hypothetical protein
MTKLNPIVWGPHFWFFFHTIALTYPRNPSSTVKKKYYEFLTNLDLFLPDPSYGKNYKQLITLYPLAPFLDNRDSLVKWTNLIHNKINKKLEKKTVTLHEFYETYYDANSKPNTIDLNFKNYKMRFLWLLFILVLIAFIAIFYYR